MTKWDKGEPNEEYSNQVERASEREHQDLIEWHHVG